MDIRRFLVYKDSKGKTQVHHHSCKFQGQRGTFKCECPFRLAAGSVDSIIGQIRAIFRDLGQGTEWNSSLGFGNPASAQLVKQYLHAIKLEQSQLRVVPKQAPPLFFNKLSMVLRHVSFQERNPKLSLAQRYLLKRDKAFFNLLSFSGDRAGDLGYLKTSDIRFLPDKSGIALTLTTGKTINCQEPRHILLFISESAEFCPVKELVSYLTFCHENNIHIKRGYAFRPLSASLSNFCDKPFTSSSANARLKLYLTRLQLWEGETPHSTRGACALTLSRLGIDSDSIKSHVGWKSDKMLQHYVSNRDYSKKELVAKTLSDYVSLKKPCVQHKLDNLSSVYNLTKVLD